MCSNRRVYALSRIYSSHIPDMVNLHDARRASAMRSAHIGCNTGYININMILIIGVHNVTPDLRSVLHNARLMYSTHIINKLLEHIDQRIKLAARAYVQELLTASMDDLQ